MFTFIKKFFSKKNKLIEPFDSSLKSMCKAQAIFEITKEYTYAVKNNKIIYPAISRKNANIIEIWADTRIEILSILYQYGDSDGILLADIAKQNNIINEYFNLKPHLEYPYTPNGEVIHDTIQAIYNMYIKIEEIGKKVGDMKSIYFSNSDEKTMFSDFESIMIKLKNYLNNNIDSKKQPILIFDLLYKDITEKIKTIALSAQLGPDYNKTMNNLINKPEITKQEKLKLEKNFEELLNLNDPDHANN